MAHVLRLKRTDDKDENLLVNITRSTEVGSKPLDLRLVAVADQSRIFHASLKDSSVKSLQAAAFTGDLDQWKTTLAYALLHTLPEGPRPDFIQGVETVSSVNQSAATITVRRNIDGITQRLGTIDLQEDNEREEINVFDWVESAAADSDDLRLQLQKLQESGRSQVEQISKLNSQLDALVKAKKVHEDDLLSKFAALLNTKKLKIRDQQRMLNGVHVDGEAAETTLSAGRSTGKGSRHADASRNGKRKAHDVGELGADDDSDQRDATDGEDKERIRQETPQTEDGNGSNDEDQDMNMIDDTLSDSTKAARPTVKKKSLHRGYMHGAVGPSTLPSREKAKGAATAAEPPPSVDEDNDDDETDDEL